uniref:Stearoyl-CoA desaturase 5 n=1 Tax=Aceria tosichella TaxID=561515 RepID=A0A6G1SE72_9ACAR
MSIKLLKVKPQEKSQDSGQQQVDRKSGQTEGGDENKSKSKKCASSTKSNGTVKTVVVGSADADPAAIKTTTTTATDNTTETTTTTTTATTTTMTSEKFEAPLVWRNIFLFVLLHSAIPVAIMMIIDPKTRPHWRTVLWSYAAAYISGLGITGGAHRLWSHRAYKARAPVEILLMILQTMAGQNSIYTWSRDHRVHHKFSETDADPHNIKRGFFFAHMGWLCCKKHPEVREKGKLIDMSDLEANPIVMFQHRHFWWMATLFMVVVPVAVPVLLWHERLWTSFVFAFMLRYILSLHGTWLVNSAAHYHGTRPYDKHMEARESPWVIMFGLGEGFHNYHHTFPFDYSTSEFGKYFNVTTALIDMFAAMGLAYDRRKMDKKSIELRQIRTGEQLAKSTSTGSKSNRGTDNDGKLLEPDERETMMTADDDEPRGELKQVSRKLVSPFSLDYISGPTSLQYTM